MGFIINENCPECAPNYYCTFHTWVNYWVSYYKRCNAIRERMFRGDGTLDAGKIEQYAKACEAVAEVTLRRVPEEDRKIRQWEEARQLAHGKLMSEGYKI